MGSQREALSALPVHVPAYSVNGDSVTFNDRCTTPGKAFLDPKEVLVRVYNATIARDGGFSGEVLATGDHIDSFGIGDYVYGGGTPCLQQYITVRADELTTKPRDLSFAEAARIYSGALIYEALRIMKEDMMVLILGDMTGFAAQICQERGCFVTSSEDFDCGETNIIDGDDFYGWLQQHTFKYDVIIDATGDLDLYECCHDFTTKRAEYISVNPQYTIKAVKSTMLPTFLGGGQRKITVAKLPKGLRRARVLSELGKKVVDGEYSIKEPRIVAFESVRAVHPSLRYVTAVNVITQRDLTPDDPEPRPEEGRASERRISDKGKKRAEPRAWDRKNYDTPTTPAQISKSPGRAPSSGSTFDGFSSSPARAKSPTPSFTHAYSPRLPSRLNQSVSASNLFDITASPSPPLSQFTPPQRTLSFGALNSSQSAIPRTVRIPPIARPAPSPRRHTDSIEASAVFDDSHFEQVELQPMLSTYEREALFGQSIDKHEDEDTSTSEEREARELQAAKDQIRFLEKQVEALMKSQATGPEQGLALMHI